MDDKKRAEIAAKVGEPWHKIDWSERKRAVAELKAEGFSRGQMAEHFGVSKGTIDYWLKYRDVYRARHPSNGEPLFEGFHRVTGSIGGAISRENRIQRQVNAVIAETIIGLSPPLQVLVALKPDLKTFIEANPETVMKIIDSPFVQGLLKRLRGPEETEGAGPYGPA